MTDDSSLLRDQSDTPSVLVDVFRCLFCKEPIRGDGRRARRDIPLGSPCPHCGHRPLVLEPIPAEERCS